jgi:hypothetical protein
MGLLQKNVALVQVSRLVALDCGINADIYSYYARLW